MSFSRILVSLVRLIRERQPNIVHTHRLKENVLGALALSLGCSRAQSLRTVHGAPEHDGSRSLRQRALHQLNRAAALRQGAIVAVSDDLADKLAGEFAKRKVRTVYNGTHGEEIRARARSATVRLPVGQRFRIGWFGRLTPVKRPEVALEVARSLQQYRPDAFELHIVGDGPLREFVCEATNALGSPPVFHHGFLTEPLPLMSQMDAVLMTSAHEGMPMVALEAMFLGVPLIVPRVGGLTVMLGDGRFGTLVHDPNSYAEVIIDLAEGRVPAKEMAAAGQRHASQHFSSSAMAQKYLEIYAELLHQDLNRLAPRKRAR